MCTGSSCGPDWYIPFFTLNDTEKVVYMLYYVGWWYRRLNLGETAQDTSSSLVEVVVVVLEILSYQIGSLSMCSYLLV